MVQFISDKTLNGLEEKFQNRNQYDKEIRLRELENEDRRNAMNVDENIGASRSQRISKPQEDNYIKNEDDPYIKNRRMWQKAINDTLNELDPITKALVEDKFWGCHSFRNWSELSKIYHVSKSTMTRLRRKVLISFGEKIGEL